LAVFFASDSAIAISFSAFALLIAAKKGLISESLQKGGVVKML
jgi:hypothetical protein